MPGPSSKSRMDLGPCSCGHQKIPLDSLPFCSLLWAGCRSVCSFGSYHSFAKAWMTPRSKPKLRVACSRQCEKLQSDKCARIYTSKRRPSVSCQMAIAELPFELKTADKLQLTRLNFRIL